jgi:hypothetical protein
MHNIIVGSVLAAICAIVAESTVGCSVIGYSIGGDIDGSNYELDSVSVTSKVDNSDTPRPSLDLERVASLANEASSGEGSVVEVITQKRAFKGDALTVDTVLAVRGESTNTGNEWLLPGELVTITFRDRDLNQVKGIVLHLGKGNIRLRVQGEDRGYGFGSVDAIYSSDKRVVSVSDLTSSQFSRNLLRVPGIVLWMKELPSMFIPLREIEKIRVTQPVVWGPARTICVVIGAAIDVAAVVGGIMLLKYGLPSGNLGL